MNHREEMDDSGRIPLEARDEIEKLLHEGKKIEAIKVYRNHTETSLKEAKEAVESIASGMGIKLTTGCLTLVMLIIVCIGFIVAMPFWWILL